MTVERRADPREWVRLPVILAGGEVGITRNVSHTGLLIDAECVQSLGTVIDFDISFPTAGGRVGFHARGEVVRVERTIDGNALAVRVLSTQLKPLDPAA